MSDDLKNTVELGWLDSIREGDDQAFEKLFHKYYLPLTRFAWGYTKSKAIAEELVQDLFLEIWEKRKTWTPFGELRPCLYRIVKEKCLNHLKHSKVKQKYDKKWVEEWTNSVHLPDDPDRDDDINRIITLLNQAVELLPERSKMIYKLHKTDGLTYSEIAQVMEISQKTVESQMSRALRTLREKLA